MTENFISIDGNKIRYLEFGNSEKVLILIHGLGASAERWEQVIPYLQKDYHIIIPDLIGFGQSDKPPVDYTVDFFSDFLKKFIDRVSVTSFHLVGSSLGGQIAAEFTAKNNHMVKRLVLVSPSGIMKQTSRALDAYIMAALYPTENRAKHAFEEMSGSTKEIDSKTITGFVERMSLPNAKMSFMSTLLGLKNAEIISTKLDKIVVPSMIVWGECDPVIPIKYSNEFISRIRDCRFYSMKNSGHTPYVDDPEQFTHIILDFLR